MLTQIFSVRRIPVVLKMLAQVKMDVIDQLKSDHILVDACFLQLSFVKDPKQRVKIVNELKRLLTTHSDAEEDIFYPACEKHPDLKQRIDESREEHRQFRSLIKEIDTDSIEDAQTRAKLMVLMEDVHHHVREEENNLFPRVRRVMSRNQLSKLGSQIRNYERREMSKETQKRAA